MYELEMAWGYVLLVNIFIHSIHIRSFGILSLQLHFYMGITGKWIQVYPVCKPLAREIE